MMSDDDNLRALSRLAQIRYPGVALPLAIEFFRSDRSRAGFGALDERRRGWRRREFQRVKKDEPETLEVIYVLAIDRPERRAPRIVDDGSGLMRVTTELVPAKKVSLGVRFPVGHLFRQDKRDSIAADLRVARRKLQAAI